MKLNTLTKLMKWFSAISLACAATSLVGVPVDIGYNGSLADDSGSLLDGEYFMKFAITNEDGTTFYWNNEDGNAATGVSAASVSVNVVQGIFSTVLEGVDATVLANSDLYLRVWVSDAADGTFEELGASPLRSVPYAVVAGTAESVDGGAISGEIDGSLLSTGSVNADKLGTIPINVPFIDANGDGIPDDPADRNVSIQTILQSISQNSALSFQDVNANRVNFEVFLDLNQQVGTVQGWSQGFLPNPGEYKDPFPIGQVYEYNGGLMPIITIVDEQGNDITGQANNPIPGLTFAWVQEDVETTSPGFGFPPFRADGLKEGRLVVQGAPTALGDYVVHVKATNRWGMNFVQDYTVHVRNVDINATLFVERQAKGSSSWTTSGASTPYGGDPVRFRFTTEDNVPLADDIVVRWTYPNPNGGSALTSDISGNAGKTFYVNSDGDPAGTGTSQGAMLIDEDPLGPDISNIGTYSAQILFDWGQGVVIGSDTIDNVLDGFTYGSFTAIKYEAPAPGEGVHNLFDQFTDSGSYTIGDESVSGQYFGASPAGDEPLWNLVSTIEAGETDKNLIGENPFNDLDGGGAYIRGVMQNKWIQQKYKRIYNGSSWVNVQQGVRDLNRTTATDGVGDPTIKLDLNGFGPMPENAGWPLSNGGGVIADSLGQRSGYSYPEDGGDFTYDSGIGKARPGGANAGDATAATFDALSYLIYNPDVMVTYWLYSTNGFIDSLAPITAIIEVGDNINIVNDLLNAQQVAGYPAHIGGDFGTTNGNYFQGLFPPVASSNTQITAWGINDLAYVWSASGNNNGFSLVNPGNANSILIPATSMVNKSTPNDNSNDFSYNLGLDSGFSQEGTGASVKVVSDVVIWDFFLQQVDLSKNEGEAGYYPQNTPDTDPSTVNESVTIDQGDDVLLTVQAYVRPSLLTGLDDGGITDGLGRDLSARFFIVPTSTNVAVEITNNITMTVDDTVGIDADADADYVQGPIENRVLVTWKVILENPLQELAATNVATGYVYAVITSKKDGQVVNTVSTLAGASNQIAPNSLALGDDTEDNLAISAGEQNVIGPDNHLDARVKMPLSSSEAVITVNPL